MPKSIVQLLQEGLIKEYLSQNMLYLKDYMTMSDDMKKSSLPEEFYWYFDSFLVEKDIDFTPPTGYVDVNGEDIGEQLEGIELVEWVENHNKPLINEFANYLFGKINDGTLDIPDADYPAWSFFDYRGLIKNQWLIHFTKDAYSISKEGFKYGVDEMGKLGLTCHLSDFEKKYGGYNFAYTIQDYVRYAKSGHYGRYTFKYGNEAVIFRASGIKLWHWGDEEPQVIFYGNTAKNIIPITGGENAEYGVKSSKTGAKLFESDDFNSVVNWIIKNYDQYRKHF